MKKKHLLFYIVSLLILLIPHFFININGNNGWGGDFSQYIQQAFNFLENGIQSSKYYIFNPNFSELAPPNYYSGFPILISPIISFFGFDYKALAYFMTLLMILMGISWFIFLQKTFSYLISFIVVIFILYSPFFLVFKNAILADIPFALFVASSLIFIQKIEKLEKFKLSIFIGFALSVSLSILTKPIGLSIILSLGLYSALLFILKNRDYEIKIKYYTAIVFIGLLVYFYVNPTLIGAIKNLDSHFFSLFAWNSLKDTILQNLNYYYDKFINISYFDIANYNFFNRIVMQVFGLLFFYGLYKSISKKVDFIFIFLLTYFFILLIFPFHQGARYFIPVLPIMLYYVLNGIKKIPFSKTSKIKFFLVLLIIGFLLPLRVRIVQLAKENNNQIYYSGPKSNDAKEMFQFIKTETKKEDIIGFIKPRVLGLYTQRACFSNFPYTQDLEKIENDFSQFNFSYLVELKDIPNDAMRIYIENHHELDTIFANNGYVVYGKK